MLLHQIKKMMEMQYDLAAFKAQFETEEHCFNYLSTLKWSIGYRCSKCGSSDAIRGRTWHHRRCKACKYDESCTANSMFHKIKIPLPTAFAIIYQLASMKMKLSSCEIARVYGIHQETAWLFRKKVLEVMNKGEDDLFNQLIRWNPCSVLTLA
jgi:hypothetical protein